MVIVKPLQEGIPQRISIDLHQQLQVILPCHPPVNFHGKNVDEAANFSPTQVLTRGRWERPGSGSGSFCLSRKQHRVHAECGGGGCNNSPSKCRESTLIFLSTKANAGVRERHPLIQSINMFLSEHASYEKCFILKSAHS